jgi:hypothetical protein
MGIYIIFFVPLRSRVVHPNIYIELLTTVGGCLCMQQCNLGEMTAGERSGHCEINDYSRNETIKNTLPPFPQIWIFAVFLHRPRLIKKRLLFLNDVLHLLRWFKFGGWGCGSQVTVILTVVVFFAMTGIISIAFEKELMGKQWLDWRTCALYLNTTASNRWERRGYCICICEKKGRHLVIPSANSHAWSVRTWVAP